MRYQEHALAVRASNHGVLGPLIAPGSHQEAEALAAIDAARDEHERHKHGETPAARRKRAARHWSRVRP